MSNTDRIFWKNYFLKEQRRVARARVVFIKEYHQEPIDALREFWQKFKGDPVAFQRRAR